MKNLLLVVALFFLCQISYAQFSYGVKGGLNVSMISFTDQKYDTSPKLGVHIGAFGSYPLNADIAIRPEIYFSAEGNKWNTSNTVGIIRLNQLRIPVLFTYQVNEKIFIEVGPQYNLLLSISQKRDDDDFEDIKNAYKSGVFGYGVGARYSIDQLLEGLSVGIRYNGDFSKINKANVGADALHCRLIQLNLSYLIGSTN